MKISILCSDENHPVNSHLLKWINEHKNNHAITLVRKREALEGGELLFLISCNEIIRQEDRSKFVKVLVIHASDLPRGRGWSPHIWQILEGRDHIWVSLLEAEDKVDAGRIWQQIKIEIPLCALWDEINQRLFAAECVLLDYAVENFGAVAPKEQSSLVEPSYYRRRTPADSELDPHRSIAEQFDLIRVCDPDRFPAFFNYRGATYTIKLEKK